MKLHFPAGLSIAPFALFTCAVSTAVAFPITFNTNAENWQVISFADTSLDNYVVIGTYAPEYFGTGGNPGGFISFQDPDNGDFTFSAPTAILGNRSGAVGTTFSYDITHEGDNTYDTTDVMFVGNGVRLLWESSTPIAFPSLWNRISFTLAPSPEWRLNSRTGPLATAQNFQTVFSNLSGLFIRGEFTDGDERAGVDNIILVPEPSSLGLALTGVAGFVASRRRRK